MYTSLSVLTIIYVLCKHSFLRLFPYHHFPQSLFLLSVPSLLYLYRLSLIVCILTLCVQYLITVLGMSLWCSACSKCVRTQFGSGCVHTVKPQHISNKLGHTYFWWYACQRAVDSLCRVVLECHYPWVRATVPCTHVQLVGYYNIFTVLSTLGAVD